MFDRLFHAHRRRKARRKLAAKRIQSVLFVCNGNAFRSPYAAAALKRMLSSSPSSAAVKIGSAGFFAPGRPAPEPAVNAARERGIDLSTHVSTLLAPSALAAVDLVAVMSEDQARSIIPNCKPGVSVLILGDLDPQSIHTRAITDPIGTDAETVARVFSRIDRCVEQLAKLIAPATASARAGKQSSQPT